CRKHLCLLNEHGSSLEFFLKEYKKSGTVGGIKMPEGMLQGDKLPDNCINRQFSFLCVELFLAALLKSSPGCGKLSAGY
nr:hypothetical protein [Oscillospiraceae bacterium]